MRLATIRTAAGTRAARVEGDRVVELVAPHVGVLLAAGDDDPVVGREAAEHAWDDVDFAPVVPRPGKIICLGLNYRSHILEMGRELPEHPTLFAKYAESLVGARDPIVLPPEVHEPDWEAELAIVIGRFVRRATPETALDAIAGYTICNDVSMRDWQYRTQQWLQGKTWDCSTPLGPVLVTPDEIDHARDLRIRCELDGTVMQEATTADLVHGPAAIVSYISTILTLKPGDVISTGTTAGVGHARKPPVYLRPGQVLRTSIEGIGELVNPCVAESDVTA
jgi:acylpyruvate hydrolase